MAYTKQTFTNGSVLNDTDLNAMSQGIYDNWKILSTGFLGDPVAISTNWTVAAINSENGSVVSMNTRIITNHIEIDGNVTVQVTGNAEICPFYYDSNKSLISTPATYQTETLNVTEDMGKYLIIMARDKSNTNAVLTTAFSSNIQITGGGERLIYTANEIDSKIKNGVSSNSAVSGLSGKKIVFLGDSIPHGQTTSGTIEIPYPQVVANNLGMTLKNYGIGGSTIAQKDNYGGAFQTKSELDAATKDTTKYYQVINGQTYQTYAYKNGSWATDSTILRTPITARYNFMDNDADVICVHCTTNDWNYDWTPLGEFSDTSVNTYYGALKQLIENLIAKYPTKMIIFITPLKRGQDPYNQPDSKNANGKTLKEYRDILIEVCEYYGIPVIDLWAISGLNPHLKSQENLFDVVKTHPLTVGHKKIGDIVASQILSLRQFITK